MSIPEFHLTVYDYALKRCVGKKMITYDKLKEAINRIAYRPSLTFYLKTIKEMEHFGLIKEISGNKRKFKRYVLLSSKTLDQRLSNRGIFPIDSLS